MSDITANRKTPLDFIAFFKEFLFINGDYSCLEYFNFTKLSQIICLINTLTLIYRHARCNCKLWNAFRFYCNFCEFCKQLTPSLCLKCCIFTKCTKIVNIT